MLRGEKGRTSAPTAFKTQAPAHTHTHSHPPHNPVQCQGSTDANSPLTGRLPRRRFRSLSTSWRLSDEANTSISLVTDEPSHTLLHINTYVLPCEYVYEIRSGAPSVPAHPPPHPPCNPPPPFLALFAARPIIRQDVPQGRNTFTCRFQTHAVRQAAVLGDRTQVIKFDTYIKH